MTKLAKEFFIIVVYVPSAELERVKQAMFDSGGGRIGNYDSCCWQVEGVGQFRPLAGSDPAVGEQGKIQQLQEARLEMTCLDNCLDAVLSALRSAHPYEEPAFHYWRVIG